MRYAMRHLLGVLMTIWAVPLAAQHMGMGHHSGEKMPMGMPDTGGMRCTMNGGMMQNMHSMMMSQMMSDPFMQAHMVIAALPTMQEHLSLSDDQVAALSQIKADYESRRSELTDRVGEAEGRLEDALSSASPSAGQVNEILREAANLKADLKAAGFEAALSMKSRLSEDQRAELDTMSLHHYMMTNMTMMEMMQVMHGDMQSNMMPGNMMQGSQDDAGGEPRQMKHGGMMR